MASADASTSQHEFPAELEQVPLTDRVPEAFGWMPSLIGGALVGMALYLLIGAPPSAASSGMYGIIAGMFIAGILLLYYEVRRRPNRTVLVPRAELIGIYRKRKFAQHMTVSQITPYRLSWSNTFAYLLIPVLLTFGLLFAAVAPSTTQRESTGTRLAALIGSLLFLAASVSLTRTRILCRHFYIPKGRRTEEILLPRAEVSRVFSGTL